MLRLLSSLYPCLLHLSICVPFFFSVLSSPTDPPNSLGLNFLQQFFSEIPYTFCLCGIRSFLADRLLAK